MSLSFIFYFFHQIEGVKIYFNYFLIIEKNVKRKLSERNYYLSRMFFHFFFRELFNPKGDAFLNFNASVDEAYRQYERKTM